MSYKLSGARWVCIIMCSSLRGCYTSGRYNIIPDLYCLLVSPVQRTHDGLYLQSLALELDFFSS